MMEQSTVQTLLEKHPGLPVIVTNIGYRHDRFAYPLFEKYENLFIEISRYFGTAVLEDVVERFGPRPLLLGSNMPHYSGTSPVSMLTYADIPRDAREAIAGGNLRTLLKEALS